MPVHLARVRSGKAKGRWTAVDAAGKRAIQPANRARARRYVTARSLAHARRRGYRVPVARKG